MYIRELNSATTSNYSSEFLKYIDDKVNTINEGVTMMLVGK